MIDALIILAIISLPPLSFMCGWHLGKAKALDDFLKYNKRMREGGRKERITDIKIKKWKGVDDE